MRRRADKCLPTSSLAAVTILDPNWNVRSSSSFGWIYLHQGGRYDTNSALYGFRHRDYSPALGRWIELDLMGFGVGENNLYRYAHNGPTIATDASGLAEGGVDPGLGAIKAADQKLTIKAQKPSTAFCGWFKWTIQWILTEASPQGGFIVQHVTFKFDVKDCHNKSVKSPCDLGKNDYWEAWLVNPGQKITSFAQKGDKNDDMYGCDEDFKCSQGNPGEKVTGNAAFYEGLSENALRDKGFIRNNPDTQAGILLSTTKDPKLTGGTASVKHNLSASWKCCPKGTNDETEVRTDP